MLTTIAIDDEPQALEVIRLLTARISFVELAATFTDAMEAMTYVAQQTVDVILLDIKMPDVTGLDWVRSLPEQPLVIFTTAYSEYAVESYELAAVDYLVKPIGFNRLLKAFNRAAQLRNTQRPTYTFLKSGPDFHRIDFASLQYVQSATNYVDLHLDHRRITVRMTLGEAQELLPEEFIQVHRGYLVNWSRVDQVIHNHIVLGEVRIPIGPSYREAVMRRLQGG